MSIMPPDPESKPAPPPSLSWCLRPETKTLRYNRAEFGYGGTYVYLLRDLAGRPLYVGVTGNPVERWRRHAQKKHWWSTVARIEFDEVWLNHEALELERQLIGSLRPLHNVRSAVPS